MYYLKINYKRSTTEICINILMLESHTWSRLFFLIRDFITFNLRCSRQTFTWVTLLLQLREETYTCTNRIVFQISSITKLSSRSMCTYVKQHLRINKRKLLNRQSRRNSVKQLPSILKCSWKTINWKLSLIKCLHQVIGEILFPRSKSSANGTWLNVLSTRIRSWSSSLNISDA